MRKQADMVAGCPHTEGRTFSWKTLGVRVTTTVTELVPSQTLAWRGLIARA